MEIALTTTQSKWIQRFGNCFSLLFQDDPQVLVATNLAWYPEGAAVPNFRTPHVMITFGVSREDRFIYDQVIEGIPPTVIFDFPSPLWKTRDRLISLQFCRDHGVSEYYQYDPYKRDFVGWTRSEDGRFDVIEKEDGWISPALAVTFRVNEQDDLAVESRIGKFVDFCDLARFYSTIKGKHRELRGAASDVLYDLHSSRKASGVSIDDDAQSARSLRSLLLTGEADN